MMGAIGLRHVSFHNHLADQTLIVCEMTASPGQRFPSAAATAAPRAPACVLSRREKVLLICHLKKKNHDFGRVTATAHTADRLPLLLQAIS